MTLTIYGIARSRAFRNLWMAEELGLSYAHEQIDFSDGPTGISSPAFKAINPMGQIPAIVDDGLMLTESLAINLYLAQKHGGSLAPRDNAEFGITMMWSLLAATQIEPHAIQVIYNRVSKPVAERDEALAVAGLAALERPLAMLDHALAGGWLTGERFTVADLNVATVIFYLRFEPTVIARFANLAAWWATISARPAYRKAMALRGE